jgi:signal transduction histidine kinase
MTDPRWPKLLSLTVHEFRSPLTVVSGYLRMILKERAGPIPDQQRRLLEEAEKSCARMSALLADVSELSLLESGTAPFNKSSIELPRLLREIIAEIPALPDRSVTIELKAETSTKVHGDAVRLKMAFTAIVLALRREIVSSDRLIIRVRTRQQEGVSLADIAIAEAVRLDVLEELGPDDLAVFDEWRGGSGLSLPNARRILEAHGGKIHGLTENGNAVAIITLPTL